MGNAAIEAARGDLSPKDARKYFEFFRSGTRREVLLLGDLVEQPTHFVRSKNHKVLCGSRVGVCELCEKAAESDDVGTRQIEYYAASFVRVWSERTFEQRVAVFSAASGEQVLRLIPDGSARGHRLDITSKAQGTSTRYTVKPLDGLPSGFPAVIPAAFDLVPFIRARFGRSQDPARPLVIYPPFSCERASHAPVGRPKTLELSAADVKPNPEDIAAIKAKVAEALGKFTKPAEPEPEPPGELATIVTAHTPAAYGPRKLVQPAQVNGKHEPGIIGDVLANLPATHPVRRAKGGAQ